MASLKHVGRVINTGRKCIVMFREMYNDKGHVVDENNCLVVETDTLPDAEHQEIIRIIESNPAQTTGDVYNVFARERLGNGMTALGWLANSNRLRKYPTSNIEMTPDARTSLRLDTLNKIVKMQKTGASQTDIENAIRDDTDMPPREIDNVIPEVVDTPVADALPAETQSGEPEVLDDSALAKNFIDQATYFEMQAKELREKAYALDPTSKPKRKYNKRTPKKEPANNKA